MTRKAHTAFLLLLLSSCTIVRQAAEYNLKTGYYQIRVNGHKEKVYATVQDDSVRAYRLIKNGTHFLADSIHFTDYTFPVSSPNAQTAKVFTKKGIDIDIISILFKYRPATDPLPPQLNTNFNAAGYFGYRWDRFAISYDRSPLKRFEKKTRHFAYGAGAFAGIGSTALNEFVTLPPINHQYEGVVIAKGITGIIGIGHLSFGIALGTDNLLGQHHNQWIYNNKWWCGLNVGLNLN